MQPTPSAPRRAPRPRVGELLMRRGYLRAEHVQACLTNQQQWGLSFGQVAVSRGYCTEPQLLEVLSGQLGLPALLDGIPEAEVDPRVTELITEPEARQYRAVPYKLSGARDEVLHVAFAAPAGLDVQDALRTRCGKSRLAAVLVGDEALERAIGWIYQGLPRNPKRNELSAAAPGATWLEAPAPAAMPFERRSPPPFAAPAAGSIATEQMKELSGIIMSAKAAQVVLDAAAQHGVSPKEVLRRVVEAWAAPFISG